MPPQIANASSRKKCHILSYIQILLMIVSNFDTTDCSLAKLLKTDDIHPPKSVISVHFFCLTCLMALQI